MKKGDFIENIKNTVYSPTLGNAQKVERCKQLLRSVDHDD